MSSLGIVVRRLEAFQPISARNVRFARVFEEKCVRTVRAWYCVELKIGARGRG